MAGYGVFAKIMRLAWLVVLVLYLGSWAYSAIRGEQLPECDSAEVRKTVAGILAKMPEGMVTAQGLPGEIGFEDGDYPKRQCRIPVTMMEQEVFLTFRVEWQNVREHIIYVAFDPGQL